MKYKKHHINNNYRYRLYIIELLNYQDNKCPICNIELIISGYSSSNKKCINIDHNHNTNIIRGLLCHKCNRYIYLKEKNSNYITNNPIINMNIDFYLIYPPSYQYDYLYKLIKSYK